MDWLKDIYDAYNQRIKSPIIGSVFLAFIACNWQPIFFVIFADVSVEDRFQYWERVTSDSTLIFIPVALGTAFAISVPFISFISAAIVVGPTNELRKLVERSSHEVALTKAEHQQELEEKREELIASKLRQERELGLVEDEETRQEIKREIDEQDYSIDSRSPSYASPLDQLPNLDSPSHVNEFGEINLDGSELIEIRSRYELLRKAALAPDIDKNNFFYDAKKLIELEGEANLLSQSQAIKKSIVSIERLRSRIVNIDTSEELELNKAMSKQYYDKISDLRALVSGISTRQINAIGE